MTDPVGVYIDKHNAVWVISAALNRVLKYNMDGQLQYYFGAYGGTRGGFPGGLSRPHQISVDTQGNLYIASWDGGWANKYTPSRARTCPSGRARAQAEELTRPNELRLLGAVP